MRSLAFLLAIPGLVPALPAAAQDGPTPLFTPTQARLDQCLQLAALDAPSALAEAAEWQEGTSGTELSFALQCQGQALVFLLRWDAAAQAFLSARDARPADAREPRARLGTMAGNAFLAGGDGTLALATLDVALADATAAGDAVMMGGIEVDRARALVVLGRTGEAALALEQARRVAPQNPESWLLSATLARRQGALDSASGWIGTALSLDPRNPEIHLEAGLIAALGGRDALAREYWGNVSRLDPGGETAQVAAAYLAQLEAAQ